MTLNPHLFLLFNESLIAFSSNSSSDSGTGISTLTYGPPTGVLIAPGPPTTFYTLLSPSPGTPIAPGPPNTFFTSFIKPSTAPLRSNPTFYSGTAGLSGLIKSVGATSTSCPPTVSFSLGFSSVGFFLSESFFLS